MTYIKYILFLLLIAIIGLSIYIAVQPNSFVVMDSQTIKAPAAVIFQTIRDTTTTDRSAFWKDSEKHENTSVIPNKSIQQSFTSKPIGNSELKWKITPNGDGTTTVSKSIAANNLSFFYKMKSIFSSKAQEKLKDQMKDDLSNLDREIIKSMSRYTIITDGITEYGGGFYMYKTTSASASNISNMMAKQFSEILNFMNDNNVTQAGMPFTIYNEMNDNGSVIMSNAVPVRDRVIVAEDGNILCAYIERTRVVKTTLNGDYKNLSEAWKTAMKYLKDNNLEQSEQHPFEIYLNDPENTPNPANYITEIYIPIKEAVVVSDVE